MEYEKNKSFSDHLKNNIKVNDYSDPLNYHVRRITPSSVDSEKAEKLRILIKILEVLNQTRNELMHRDTFASVYDLTLEKIQELLIDYLGGN